jgi:hypothetical protein
MGEQPPWNSYGQQDPNQWQGQPPYQSQPPYSPQQTYGRQQQPQHYLPPQQQQQFYPPQQQFYPPQQPLKKKRHWVRNIFLSLAGFMVLIVIISVATNGGSNGTPAAGSGAAPANVSIHVLLPTF